MVNNFIWNSNLKIRLIGETIFNVFYWMYFPFLAIYFSQSFGLGWTGIFMTIPPIISLIAGMVGGSVADRMGRKKIMLWGTGIQLMMFILFASSNYIWLDYVAFLGITFGTGVYKPASDAMVADTVPAEHRKKVFASFLTGSNLGAVCGPILGAWLFFDYREELLWCCALVLLIYFSVIFTRFKETLPIDTNLNSKEVPISPFEQLKGYVTILKDKQFAFYLFAGVFSVIAIMQLDLYLAIYIFEEVPSQSILSNFQFELSNQEILG